MSAAAGSIVIACVKQEEKSEFISCKSESDFVPFALLFSAFSLNFSTAGRGVSSLGDDKSVVTCVDPEEKSKLASSNELDFLCQWNDDFFAVIPVLMTSSVLMSEALFFSDVSAAGCGFASLGDDDSVVYSVSQKEKTLFMASRELEFFRR